MIDIVPYLSTKVTLGDHRLFELTISIGYGQIVFLLFLTFSLRFRSAETV